MKKIFYQICAAFILNKQSKKAFRRKYITPLKRIEPICEKDPFVADSVVSIAHDYTEYSELIINQDLRRNNKFIAFDNGVSLCGNNFVTKGTKIGRYSYIGEYTKIDDKVIIGRYCSIADNVLIGATRHPTNWLSTSPFQYDYWIDAKCPKKQYTISKKTEIGNDVWIGANVIIQTGITVGDGAIIGSGAVVTHDIPPYGIAVGVPAKVIKYRFNEDIIKILLDKKWWNRKHEYIQKLPFDDIDKCLEILK